MENNKLQDPFFQQVFKPLVAKVRREQKIALFIRGDEEKKTDKATRCLLYTSPCVIARPTSAFMWMASLPAWPA